MRVRRLLILPVVALLVTRASAVEEKKVVSDEIAADLRTAVEAIAKRHSLSTSELRTSLGRLLLEGRDVAKGGVGLVEGETFVLPNRRRNSLKVGEETWEGASSEQAEVVVTDGTRVLGSVAGADPAKLTVIVFQPDEVGYVIWNRKIGATFARERDAR